MREGTKFLSEDGCIFETICVGHWSDILEIGGEQRVDIIKFFATDKGYDVYISRDGKKYILIEK